MIREVIPPADKATQDELEAKWKDADKASRQAWAAYKRSTGRISEYEQEDAAIAAEAERQAEEARRIRAERRRMRRAPDTANTYEGDSIADILEHTMRLYKEALLDLTEELEYDREEAKRRAIEAWRATLPDLTSRTNVLAYIACVSWGLKNALLTASEAKTLMFIAQTQLTALKEPGNVLKVEAVEAKEPVPAAPGLFNGETDPGRFDLKGGSKHA